MNPRAKEFERDQRYASARDRALSVYIALRTEGWDTHRAWEAARSIPVTILEPALRS